ncbi:MAG TPA: FkbM family methyltransferase [Steroidobacteraceae bacterium]|jgi:hypothetical protein
MKEPLCTLAALKKAGRWLNEYSKDVYSQTGEDGVIAKALEMLPARDRWCVEFGAWDGKHLSNTFNLVENESYNVVLVEGDKSKYQRLRTEYPYGERAIFVGQFVGWEENDNLDTILEKTQIPLDFDLLSIDVDGNDYHIWNAVQKFKPKLVLVEFNPTSSNRFDFVQPPDPNCNQSNSPAALIRLAKSKGYELICVIGANLLFVDREYYEAFHIPDNSLEILRNEDEVTHLFLGFDGSLIVDGPALLRWHGLPLKVNQPFPRALRRYPPNYDPWRRMLFRIWKRLHRFV